MKTLYESILSSTKSGAATILEQWCKENLDNEDIWHSNEYEIKNGVQGHHFLFGFIDIIVINKKEGIPSFFYIILLVKFALQEFKLLLVI